MNKREKLIEQLRWWAAECDRTNFGCQARKLLIEAADELANCVTFATDTNAGSKWISVEDKMPHAEYGESDNVLTINRVGICKVLYFDGGCWCYPTGEPVSFGNPRWRITHWMPLPEPPKEG